VSALPDGVVVASEGWALFVVDVIGEDFLVWSLHREFIIMF